MIQVNDLWKNFGRHDALRGLSFSVPQSSAYALIGANGAGKTTTIKVLMNILSPTRGSATVLGVDSRRISLRQLSRIGYVSETKTCPRGLPCLNTWTICARSIPVGTAIWKALSGVSFVFLRNAVSAICRTECG